MGSVTLSLCVRRGKGAARSVSDGNGRRRATLPNSRPKKPTTNVTVCPLHTCREIGTDSTTEQFTAKGSPTAGKVGERLTASPKVNHGYLGESERAGD